MIVVDSNVIASLWVPNDKEDLAYEVLRKDPDWVAPLLWRSEFRNVLALYLRKGLLDFTAILQAAEEAEQLMDARSYEVNTTQILQKVRISDCSAYDCEFVALADDLGLTLVSFDKQICREFSDFATHPVEFIS